MAERDLGNRLRRAVKENNLPLVRRLVQRTGIRNPDPDHKRFTSLAWAAALGHEETFEFLLHAGHDDEEPSKDVDNDTILILLAETKGASVTSPYRSFHHDGPTVGATLRMANMYFDRYPDTLDWSNVKGRTALHVAALKGNEELAGMLCDLGADPDLTDNDGNTPLHYASAWGHVPIVQICIERGCQYTVKNNEGFTASDYAYSYSTKDTLQDSARSQYETLKSKRSRRNLLQATASRTGSSRDRLSPTPPPVPAKTRGSPKDLTPQNNRMRSGSAASYETGTTDSGEYQSESIRHKPSYSSLSTTASSPSNPGPPGAPFRGPAGSSRTSSSNGTLHSPSPSNPISLHPHGASNNSALSPVATRVRAQDADAMEKWMAARTRTRSGSADTGTDFQTAFGSGATTPGAAPGTPYNDYMSAGPSDNGDDISALANLNLSGSVAPRRRLRPSQSASQLNHNGAPSPPLLNTNVAPRDHAGARLRAGTGPAELPLKEPPTPPAKPPSLTPPSDRVLFNSPTQLVASPRPSLNRDEHSRRDEHVHVRRDYTGPSVAYAQFPEPPGRGPLQAQGQSQSQSQSQGQAQIITAPSRQDTGETVKTPTQPSTRRMPFKLSKGSSGSIDTNSYRNGVAVPGVGMGRAL